MNHDEYRPKTFWGSWQGLCAMLLIAALLFFLITEHTAHFFGALPFAIFLLCPILHIFMHRHGGPDKPGQSGGGHQH
jgi:hypothetical protein